MTMSKLKLFTDKAWSEPWFGSMLIDGLKNEGMSSLAAQELQRKFDRIQPKNLNELLAGALSDSTGPHSNEIISHLNRLAEISRFNQTCYRQSEPESRRVVAWPNNQTARVQDPTSYYDIFEDLPYRDTHRFISNTTPIGSAGSCFALRIAHQLQAWKYNYIVEEDDLPPEIPLDRLSETSYRMGPARVGTLFNTPSMRQMVERAFGVSTTEQIIVRNHGRLLDPFRSIRPFYQDETGYLDDYERHTAALRRALEQCDAFILTLGLTEAWKFAHSGEFTSVAPYRIDPSVLRPHELTVAENVAELERLYSVFRRFRPSIKLIISVSPVPLNKTFSTRHHVVTANCLSKATLRVAAEEFCNCHPDSAFYFPAFETVMYGTRNPWEKDMRHVSAEAVDRVMQLFRTMFLVDQSGSLPTQHHAEPTRRLPMKAHLKGWAKVGIRRLGLQRTVSKLRSRA